MPTDFSLVGGTEGAVQWRQLCTLFSECANMHALSFFTQKTSSNNPFLTPPATQMKRSVHA